MPTRDREHGCDTVRMSRLLRPQSTSHRLWRAPMTAEERDACLAALDAAERAAQALRAVLGAPPSEPAEMVPLSQACRVWGVSKDAALKRARRGLGRKIAGRWHVPTDAL